MVLAIAEGEDGRTILVIGLSHGNLARLRADGLNGHIRIDGKSKNLPIDIMISAAETEFDIARSLQAFVTADTKVFVDPKLKG